MTGTARINSTGINQVKLGENISNYKEALKFSEFSEAGLFQVSHPENVFYLPYGIMQSDSLHVKYVFVNTDSFGIIKRITLFLDDSADAALAILEKDLGKEKTTAQSSIGQAYGNIGYGWTTPDKTVITMFKARNTSSLLKFPVTTIQITRQSDIISLMDVSIHAKLDLD